MPSSANLPAGFLITTLNGTRHIAGSQSFTDIPQLSTTTTSVESTARTSPPSTSLESIKSSTQTTPESSSNIAPSSIAVAVPVPVVTNSQITVANEPQNTQIFPETPIASDISTTTPIPATPIPTTHPIPATTSISSTSQASSSSPISPNIVVTSLASSTGVTTPSPLQQITAPTESSTPSISTSTAPNESGTALQNTVHNQDGASSSTKTSNTLAPGPTTNAVVPTQSSIFEATSKSQVAPAPIVGGVVGSVAFLGVIALILWVFKKRRRYQRNSLLTPLGGEMNSFNEGDLQPIRDGKPMSRFGAQFKDKSNRLRYLFSGIAAGIAGLGASLKSKVLRHPRDTPSVDLDRGNGQFFDGAIPRHSRNISDVSDIYSKHTIKDRFNDWRKRCIGTVGFSWTLRRNKRLLDHFPTTGSLSEKQSGGSASRGFSQLLRINERDWQLQANGQRGTTSASNDLESSVLKPENFGLGFQSNNPLSSPLSVESTAQKQPDNSFIDPVSQTQPAENNSTYTGDDDRLGEQPTNPTKDKQAALRSSIASSPNPPCASAIDLDRDNYRDTISLALPTNSREEKGRSDPFDLEPPGPWLPLKANGTVIANDSQNITRTSSYPNTPSSPSGFPNPLRMSSVQGTVVDQASNHTRQPSIAQARAVSSVYSSGASSLSKWAEPGPDLDPGSGNTNLRGSTSSGEDFPYRNDSTGGVYSQGAGNLQGGLSEIDLALAIQRDVHNVSPLSTELKWADRRETDNTSLVSMVSDYSRRGVGRALR